jgi:hypothetical protein
LISAIQRLIKVLLLRVDILLRLKTEDSQWS